VSNLKLWKEIVNEFDLPPSCTSASFTLKNHYQKYLLTYEQKCYFGKKEEEMVRELGNLRQRRSNLDPNRENRNDAYRDRVLLHETNLRQDLTGFFEERKTSKTEYLNFMRKNTFNAYTGELKRVMLAFESRLQEEIRFSLNCLLLYSCSTNAPYCIENAPMVFEGMVNYLDSIIPLIPDVFCRDADKKADESSSDTYFGEIGEVGLGNGFSPIELVKRDRRQMITMRYEEVSKSEVLEQVRIIFQIVRNLIYVKENEPIIYKHKKINGIILDTFFSCLDQEVNRTVLDIVSVLCKQILIAAIPNKNSKQFCIKIIEYLGSEAQEEYEAALECFHNLMLSQENEITIESMLQSMIDSITRLLFLANTDVVESSLEILCYLSDLKMSTRLILAKKNNLISRLLALIGGNVNKHSEKIAKLSAIILSNLCVTPATKQHFVPFEKDIFCLATIDDTVSEQLSHILLEVEPIGNNLHQGSKDFYERKRKTVAELGTGS
jgi:hypothetical protein